jgi:hypothetical protein
VDQIPFFPTVREITVLFLISANNFVYVYEPDSKQFLLDGYRFEKFKNGAIGFKSIPLASEFLGRDDSHHYFISEVVGFPKSVDYF